jgi:septum site-determining protein MinD
MGRGVVFAVAGAKGGVGKTTTSINLSAVLARRGRSVLLVELDVAMANVGDFLDLDVRLDDGRDPTLHEVLAGEATLEAATYRAPGGFDAAPSGTTLEGFVDTDVGVLSSVVAEARTRYDVVVLDTGAGLATESLLPLALADATILVSSPRVASIRDTEKTRDLVQHVGGLVAGVVFVRSGSGRSPGVDHIAHFLGTELLGHVPEDGAVADAQDIGQPVVVAHRDSDAGRAYEALGERLDGFVEPLQDRDATTVERLSQPGREATSQTRDEATLETTTPDGTGFGFVTEGEDTGSESTGRRGPASHRGRTEEEQVARRSGDERDGTDTDDGVRTHDGHRVYVAHDEGLRGTDGTFRPVYADADHEECVGWACRCGNVGLDTDPAGRLDCPDCGNTSRATRWDAAGL